MNGLEFRPGCLCAGTGCGGHLVFTPWPADTAITPVGYQGAAQHTYTRACDGFHEPGSCPPGRQAVLYPGLVEFTPIGYRWAESGDSAG